MFSGEKINLFFDNIYAYYEALPNEGKLVLYIVLILIFIASILLIIMLEQRRLNKKIVNKKVEVSDNTEVLNFDFDDIDETNEKTRNLKEITDKIQAVIDNKNIDLTSFERDQEENSIISYDELMKSVGKKVDAPKQEFSLPDLVRKIEVDEEIEKTQPYMNPVSPIEDKKFKSSVFISPVFGVQGQSSTVIKEEPAPIKTVSEQKEIESFNEEETFLKSLVNFRKNLE